LTRAAQNERGWFWSTSLGLAVIARTCEAKNKLRGQFDLLKVDLMMVAGTCEAGE